MSEHIDPEAELLEAMAQYGLHPPTPIVWDGEFQRFPGIDAKKQSDDAGWYKAFPDRKGAAFGDHRRNLSESWQLSEPQSKMTAHQWREAKARWERQDRSRKAARTRVERAAAQVAQEEWANAKPAPAHHAYLKAKGITDPRGLRVDKEGRLLVPMLTIERSKRTKKPILCSLLFISPDGTKRFMPNGRVKDTRNTIGAHYLKKDENGKLTPWQTIYVCEGWATGWSISTVVEAPVLVALMRSNLESVARYASENFPGQRIVVACDNDRWSRHFGPNNELLINPGVHDGRAAAEAVGCEYAIPDFPDDLVSVPPGGKGPTDFNDLHRAVGSDAVMHWLDPDRADEAETADPELAKEIAETREARPAAPAAASDSPGEPGDGEATETGHKGDDDPPTPGDLLGEASWPDHPELPGPPDPEPLPPDALPLALKEFVETVAGNLQVPGDLPFVLTLSSIAAAVAGKVEIEVRSGWRESLSLYTAAVLPPASRKSPAFAVTTAPLREWEADAVRSAGPLVRAAMDVAEVAEKRLEKAKRDAATNGKSGPEEVEAARLELEDAVQRIPPDGRLLAGDITPEAIVKRMAAQGGRLAVMEPEPGPLQLLAGRYSDAARLDEIKKAWSGESILVDRIGRPPLRVERPSLTLALCLQPGVLEGLQHSKTFRLEGVLGRILWVWPDHGLGRRLTGHDVPRLDEEACGRFRDLVHVLLDEQVRTTAGNGSAVPHLLHVTPEALAVIHEFESEVEAALADGGTFAGVRDWAGKAVGQAVRIGTLLELASRAAAGAPVLRGAVGPEWMTGAVRIVRSLSTHAMRVLGASGIDRRTADLAYVLHRARGLPDGASLRDLHRATQGHSSIETMEDLRTFLDDLVERGCVRLVEQPPAGGRPPSPLIKVHPELGPKYDRSDKSRPQNPTKRAYVTNVTAIGGESAKLSEALENA